MAHVSVNMRSGRAAVVPRLAAKVGPQLTPERLWSLLDCGRQQRKRDARRLPRGPGPPLRSLHCRHVVLWSFLGYVNTSGRLTAAQKARKAIDLRCQGVSWDDVAIQCGYANAPNACRAVRQALARYPSQSVDELRAIEDLKLDRLEQEVWRQYRTVRWATCSRGLVTDADGSPVPDNSHRERWASILLRVYERRARLHGLDKPVSIRLAGDEDALDAEIEELIVELTAQPGPAAPASPPGPVL